MIYDTTRAAKKLQISVKQLNRYANRIRKRPQLIGTRWRMAYSEQELSIIQSLLSKS